MRGAMAEKEPGRGLFEWLQTLMTAVVCMVLLFTFVGRVVRVDGRSMDPTLAHGELLLVWSMGYEPRANSLLCGDYQAGDIVIASKTTAEPLEGEAVVKRAVALAGQTVELDYGEGRVLVDGQALAEPYLLEPMALPQKPEMQGTRFQVEADSLFLLGDNRNGSTDSRHSGVGSVHRDCLLGRAVAVIWPLDRLRLL